MLVPPRLDVRFRVHVVGVEDRDTVAKRLFGHGSCYVHPRLGAAGTEVVVADVEEGDEGVFLRSLEFEVLL